MPSPVGEPDILVLICDQQQRNVLDIYGGAVQTRAWRDLAANGVVFDHFYCATPLCVPTRPSMMTGRWPHAHGSTSFSDGSVEDSDYGLVNSGEELLIDRLHDTGYRVAHAGIWHINRLPGDDRSGEYPLFREKQFPYREYRDMRGDLSPGDKPAAVAVETPSETGRKEWSFSTPVPVLWRGPIEDHPDMVSARTIADFIASTPRDQPLAAWCSVGAPHPPLLVPEPFFGMFDAKDMVPPPGFGADMSHLPRTIRDMAPGRQAVRDWTWESWATAIAAYYGYTAFADHCMQVVLDAVEKAGRTSRTIIAATTDHGEMLGSHNLYQKGVLYDRACRLPFVLRAPWIQGGRRSQLASQVDLAPTLLDLAGRAPMDRAQGQSLVPILETPSTKGPDHQFIEFNGYIEGGIYTRAVVTDRFKYIYHHLDKELLFDRCSDPDELHNLADGVAHAPTLNALRRALRRWMHDTGDFLNLEF